MNISESAGDKTLQLVTFVVGQEEYGVEILSVREIIRSAAITRVPNAPDVIRGVINLRGKVVPVVDLRSRFGLPRQDQNRANRVVVIELAGQIVGFIVDAVREVIHVDSVLVEPPPELTVGADEHFIAGIARLEDRLVILLDPERVLSLEEVRALEATDLAG
ncbi:MAG TPA: chemotaxis protein CheW [Rhodothermales bacterium]|nr:chemotaxis protein CheW [Rhodothermales bacterium]